MRTGALSTALAGSAIGMLLVAPAGGAPARWAQVGGTSINAGLAGPAGSPVERAWFSADGRRLYAALPGGETWFSEDAGLSWTRADPDAAEPRAALEPIDTGGRHVRATVRNPYRPGVAYALGEHLYRSDDGGSEWTNLTALGGGSVIGRWQSTIAISPADPSLVVVSNSRGLWKSYDEGITWSSLNRGLPNFPAARFQSVDGSSALALESDALGRLELHRASSGPLWRTARAVPRPSSGLPRGDLERVRNPPPLVPRGYAVSHRVWRDGRPLTGDLTGCGDGASCSGQGITALQANGRLWAATTNGRIWVSRDDGATWALSWVDPDGRPVTDLWAHPSQRDTALAVAGGRVLRSTNSGTSWFDISGNLPDSDWSAVTGHVAGGSVFVGGSLGIFYSRVSLTQPGPAGAWTEITGALATGRAVDLALDPLRGRLYAALPGYGVFWTRLPHVASALRAVSAADFSQTAAAPGSLLTVLGIEAGRASADGRAAPILDVGDGRTQLQVPFGVRGRSLRLGLQAADANHVVEMPLGKVAPAIFVVSGEALVLDAGTGSLIGWERPARAGGSVLVMMSGLGAVDPPWPAGVAAPERDAPRPRARIEASLDGAPLEVLSAKLAAGYTGVYVVEAAIPADARPGGARLVISADAEPSEAVELVIGSPRR